MVVRVTLIGRRKVAIDAVLATAAAACVLTSCGGSEPGAGRTSPAQVTPVPSGTPAPTPPDTLHSGGESPTATPADEGGDEGGIRIGVAVRIMRQRLVPDREVVPAFLPLRLTLVSSLDRAVRVTVVRPGTGRSIARAAVPAGGSARIDLGGLQPGLVEVRAPGVARRRRAVVRVDAG